MKLLHDIFRLRSPGLRGDTTCAPAVLPEFTAAVSTVPVVPAIDTDPLVAPAPARREPASFLKTPRRRRLSSRRRD